MRSLLVTSEVTFVGDNYHQVVLGLATNPFVVGLVVIQNRGLDLTLKSLLGILTFAAPRFGLQLLMNTILPGTSKKIKAYEREGKKVFFTKDINDPECLKWMEEQKIDLIVNARSRSFFREKVLSLPRLGCINIHHGLLPDQRGVMCDFWGHLNRTAYGFTVHQMTKKIDDGPILLVQQVDNGHGNYMRSLYESSKIEVNALSDIIGLIQSKDRIDGITNTKSEKTKYFKNPQLRDFYKLRLKGTKV